MDKQNITLIGMAGAGKSSIGVLLAQLLGWDFFDIDILLEKEHDKKLQEILDQEGEKSFQELEATKVIELANTPATVLAPGGSIVYSPEAMDLLKSTSVIVYLSTHPNIILQRIDTSSRGIVGLKDKSFGDLFAEREKLYKQYADISIDVGEKSPEELVKEIWAQFQGASKW